MHQQNSSPSTSTAARTVSTAEKVRPQKTPPGAKTPPAAQSVPDRDASTQPMVPDARAASEPAGDQPGEQAEQKSGTSPVAVVISARQGEASQTFRRLAQEKLSKITKFDSKIHRVDVELTHEPNPRQAQLAARVELTVRTRGPVVRAEAGASEPIAALDAAWQKLQIRLRRSHNRRRHHGHRGKHGATSSASLAAELAADSAVLAAPNQPESPAGVASADLISQDGEGPFLLREKTHQAPAMSVDEALYAMELVGHDFFLFVEAGSSQPCVLYTRHGYSYGLLRLETVPVDSQQ